jgi:hypothetical protein
MVISSILFCSTTEILTDDENWTICYYELVLIHVVTVEIFVTNSSRNIIYYHGTTYVWSFKTVWIGKISHKIPFWEDVVICHVSLATVFHTFLWKWGYIKYCGSQ